MEFSKVITRLGAISLVALTAACSSNSSSTSGTGTLGVSGSGGGPEPDPITAAEFAAFSALAEQDKDRVAPLGLLVSDDMDPTTINGIQGTKFAQLTATTSGQATYTGPGMIEIFDRSAGATPVDTTVVEMLGTATVTVEFTTDTFSGRIRDMYARNAAGETDFVDGTVNIINGDQVNPANRPTQVEADASGVLEAFGTTYTISAELDGLLRGTNPTATDNIPVRAITLEGEGTVANSTSLVGIEVVGDKDAGNVGNFVNR